MTGPSRARGALLAVMAVAVVVSAALLGLGVVLERTTTAGAAAVTGVSAPAGHRETGEQSGAAGHSEAAEQGTAGHDAPAQTSTPADPDHGREETVLGIPIDSPIPGGVFVVVCLGLAALVWRRPTRPVSTVVIVVAVAAGVLDVAEVVHQLGLDRAGLATLAVGVAALHLAVITGAGWLWATPSTGTTTGGRPAHAGI